eukprot:5253464-Alexandrium_andersonii.AAC.1
MCLLWVRELGSAITLKLRAPDLAVLRWSFGTKKLSPSGHGTDSPWGCLTLLFGFPYAVLLADFPAQFGASLCRGRSDCGFRLTNVIWNTGGSGTQLCMRRE